MNILPGWMPSSPAGLTPPRMRYVNTYAMAFGGASSATMTVPAIDLVFPASATKQILVFVPAEAPTVSGVTVNGALAAQICDANQFLGAFSAVYAGAGPFNIVVTLSGTSSENGAIAVYEIDEAAPVYQGARNYISRGTGTAIPLPTRVPDNGLSVACCMDTTNTVTNTWTGATERNDTNTGDYNVSSADNVTPVVGNTSQSILDTLSGSSSAKAISLAIPPNKVQLQGGFRRDGAATVIGSAATFSAGQNYTGLGNFRLVFFVSYQSDVPISGVTFNGNACTFIGGAANATASPDLRTYAWYIDVTQAAPSGNVVVTLSSGALGLQVLLSRALLYNVGSVGDVQTGSSGVAAGAALQVDVNDGGIILAYHIHDTPTDTSTWTGLDAGLNLGASDLGVHMATRAYCAAEVNRAIQCTASGAAQNCTIAIAFNP